MLIKNLTPGSKIFILEPTSSTNNTPKYFIWTLNDINYYPSYNNNLCALVRDSYTSNVPNYNNVYFGYETIFDNEWGQSYINYKQSDPPALDPYCNNIWYNAMPEETKSKIVQAYYPIVKNAMNGDIENIVRYVCVPSLSEWFGSSEVTFEGEQFDYIENAVEALKEKYFTRSVISELSVALMSVNVSNNKPVFEEIDCSEKAHFRPMFCVSGDTLVSNYTFNGINGYIFSNAPSEVTNVKFSFNNSSIGTRLENVQINFPLQLNWTASAEASSYNIYTSQTVDNTSWDLLGTAQQSSSPFFNIVTPNKGYQYCKYAVKAATNGIESDFSNFVELSTKKSDVYYRENGTWKIGALMYRDNSQWLDINSSIKIFNEDRWIDYK